MRQLRQIKLPICLNSLILGQCLAQKKLLKNVSHCFSCMPGAVLGPRDAMVGSGFLLELPGREIGIKE